MSSLQYPCTGTFEEGHNVCQQNDVKCCMAQSDLNDLIVRIIDNSDFVFSTSIQCIQIKNQ